MGWGGELEMRGKEGIVGCSDLKIKKKYLKDGTYRNQKKKKVINQVNKT